MKSADEKNTGGKLSKKAFVHADVFERITDAFMALDKNFYYTYINKKACELSHREASSLIGKNIWDEFPQSVGRPFYHAVTASMQQQTYMHLEDYYPETDQWFENHIYPSTKGVSIYFRDITDKKKLEIALKESEEKYRLMIEQSHDGIFIADASGKIIEVNSKACQMSGYKKDELLKRTLLDLTPESRRQKAPELFDVLGKGQPIFLEGQLLTKDGSMLLVEISSQMIQGGKIAMFSRDITRRKIAEQQLHEAESKFRDLVEKSLVCVYIIQDEKFAYVNPKFVEEYGFEGDELIGADIYSVIAGEDERKKVADNIRARLAGEQDSMQYEMIALRKDGSTMNVEVYGSRTQYKGRPAIIGTLINITERKKAELELREAEEKFRSLVEKSLVGVYIIQDSKFAYVNPKICEEYGYSREELIGADISITAKDKAEMKKVNEHIRSRLAGEEDSVHYEMRLKKKDSTLIDVEVFGSRTQYKGRSAIIGTLINITERKRAELQLLQSRQKYKLLFESNPVPMWMFSKVDFSIIDVNDAACKLYGYSRDEFLKMNIRDMRPVEDIPRFVEKISEMRATNTNQGIWRHRKKDGNIISVEVIGNDITYQGRSVRLALANDVTDKIAAEEGLKKSYEEIRQLTEHLQNIREEERTSIAREIHDELGQQLTVLKMDVSWIDRKLSNVDPAIKEKLSDLINVLNQTVKTVRRISSELRPSLLDDLGLVAAVEWHLKEFGKRCAIKTQFDAPVKELSLNDATKTTLFRIMQESLTNVARHSHAKTVKVNLFESSENIVLRIEDDGIGFDEKKAANKRTLGILGMKERTAMIGGKYKISSGEGKGTTVLVSVPYHK
jgi:PAS domain S-box-containing protein